MTNTHSAAQLKSVDDDARNYGYGKGDIEGTFIGILMDTDIEVDQSGKRIMTGEIHIANRDYVPRVFKIRIDLSTEKGCAQFNLLAWAVGIDAGHDIEGTEELEGYKFAFQRRAFRGITHYARADADLNYGYGVFNA